MIMSVKVSFYLIRFFVLILGALTAPPSILAPVMKIPLMIDKR
jgi:hypothetical protein